MSFCLIKGICFSDKKLLLALNPGPEHVDDGQILVRKNEVALVIELNDEVLGSIAGSELKINDTVVPDHGQLL